MARPFDATLKFLIETYPQDWLALAGLPVEPVELLDADLATISLASDKVIRVLAKPPYLFQIEFQAGDDPDLDRRVLAYNVLLELRHNLPVESVVLLLRPKAQSGVQGRVQRFHRDGSPYLDFRYRLIRLWDVPVDDVLAGEIGTLPLAPLAKVRKDRLPAIIRRMAARLEREVSAVRAKEIWTATYILMGLKHPEALAERLLQGVLSMKESVTYQKILREGRAEGLEEGLAEGRAQEARNLLLGLGARRLGTPAPEVRATIEAISEPARLEKLVYRLEEVEDWNELLASEPSDATG